MPARACSRSTPSWPSATSSGGNARCTRCVSAAGRSRPSGHGRAVASFPSSLIPDRRGGATVPRVVAAGFPQPSVRAAATFSPKNGTNRQFGTVRGAFRADRVFTTWGFLASGRVRGCSWLERGLLHRTKLPISAIRRAFSGFGMILARLTGRALSGGQRLASVFAPGAPCDAARPARCGIPTRSSFA